MRASQRAITKPLGEAKAILFKGDGSSFEELASLGRRLILSHLERARWYPKDGDLCLTWTKPEETLVEVRSDSDVQIDRRS